MENIVNLSNKTDFEIVSLIKPQFEAGKEQVGKNGVVRDKETHVEVIKNVIQFAKNLKLNVKNLTYSPIRGPKGNIEYLVYLTSKETDFEIPVEEVVEQAHRETI